ncbi:hypothetical protein H8959_008095, partial [Pygathrix nigripes]
DPNICAVFAVQGGKMGRKHGIKRGRRPSMRNPAQQARGPWIHENKHPAFAKQQINLEMPNSGVITERAWVIYHSSSWVLHSSHCSTEPRTILGASTVKIVLACLAAI